MPLPYASRTLGRTVAVACAALAIWWMFAPRAAMPPVFPLGDQPVYTTSDDVRLQLLEPVLHAPWLTEVGPGAIFWALIVFAAGAGLAVVAGTTTAAVLFAMTALALDPSFSSALAHQSGLAIAVGFVWLAAGGAFSEPRHPGPRPWLRSLSAIGLWSIAVWWHWMALAAWPLVLAGLRRRPQRPARGVWTAASIVAGTLAFAAGLAWLAASATSHSIGSDAPLTWRDALMVAFDGRPEVPPGSFVAPDVTIRPSALALALAAAGLAFGGLVGWWRRAVILTVLALGAVALAWPEWRGDAVRFGGWLLVPLTAAGLAWAARHVPPGRAAVATCAVGLLLVAETAMNRARPLEGQEARRFRDAFETELASAGPDGLVVVNEDTRLDSALAAWMSSRPGAVRAPQSGAALSDARLRGATILAGPTARRQLLLEGVRFTDGFAIRDPAPLFMSRVSDTLGCATVREDRWSLLPGVDYTGRLGVEIPARPGGAMTLIVGDALPLAIRVETPDGRQVPVEIDHLLSGPGSEAPPADYWLESGAPDASPQLVSRVQLAAHPVRSTLLSVRLGRRSPRVLARLSGFSERARGRICAAPVGDRDRFDGQQVEEPVRLDQYDEFGRGWYGIEPVASGRARWTDGDAVVLLMSAARADVDVSIDAESAQSVFRRNSRGGAGPTTVTLHVNGIDVGARAMQPGMQRYAWQVPAGTWVTGTNELWWHTAPVLRPADEGGEDTRKLGMRVSRVMLSRTGETQSSP